MLNKPHTGGLRILARQNTLTDTNWFELLEERRALIEPHLRDMTLKSLGDLKIVRGDKGGHNLGRPLRLGATVEKTYTNPPHYKYREPSELKIAEGPFSLDTRGIFPNDDVYYYGHFKWQHIDKPHGQLGAIGLITKFWGLTRNNQWLKAECTEKYFTQLGWKGRPEQGSEVEKFIVSESTPQEICEFCDITPRIMWQRLGDVAQAWVEHRQFLLGNAEQLIETIRREEWMVEIVVPE